MAKRKRRKKRNNRNRKPAAVSPASAEAAKPRRDERQRPAGDGPPPPPWGDFPLTQLVVLGGLVLLVVGMFTSSASRVLIGLGMGSVGGLELALREHLSGYRSHTTLLAGVGFGIAIGVTGYGFRLKIWVCLLAGLVVFAALAWLLRRRFMAVAGGRSFRLR